MDEPRTYSGWRVGLAIVGVTLVVFGTLNLIGDLRRDEPRRPRPVVTTVPASARP